jgi:RNA recognition motif-containing protein
VGNLNFATSQDELVELFSAAGQIIDCHIPTDKISGRPRGFAFIEFSNDDEAAAAIEKFNGHELGGRELRVNEAEERPPRRFDGPRPYRPGGGGGPGGRGKRGGKSKGSRRGLRGRKRSL